MINGLPDCTALPSPPGTGLSALTMIDLNATIVTIVVSAAPLAGRAGEGRGGSSGSRVSYWAVMAVRGSPRPLDVTRSEQATLSRQPRISSSAQSGHTGFPQG